MESYKMGKKCYCYCASKDTRKHISNYSCKKKTQTVTLDLQSVEILRSWLFVAIVISKLRKFANKCKTE